MGLLAIVVAGELLGFFRTHGHQQDQTEREQDRDGRAAQRRERRADQDAGERRPDRLPEGGPDHPLNPIGGQQILRRQDARQVSTVGGEEERRSRTEYRRGNGHVPQPQ